MRRLLIARKAMLPLTVFAYLSGCSSFVLILPHETGLRYQFGVPDADTLSPGVTSNGRGRVRNPSCPSARILSMKIGHEEEEGEEEEEESILWANQHAEEEFSYLWEIRSISLRLMNASISNSDARHYLPRGKTRSPARRDCLSGALYCAQRTLSDALSENLQVLADDVLNRFSSRPRI